MSKFLVEVAVCCLAFLFLWKVVGKPTIRWIGGPPPSFDEPSPPAMTVDELKALRAKLHDRIAKLKNKGEIAKLREQLNKINDQLADLV